MRPYQNLFFLIVIYDPKTLCTEYLPPGMLSLIVIFHFYQVCKLQSLYSGSNALSLHCEL